VAASELPSHTHEMRATGGAATTADPTGKTWANSAGALQYTDAATSDSMAAQSIQTAGGGGAHENRMPYLCVHFIIAMQGIFPPSS
jgi:microcystin-dependent protein